MGFVLDHCIKRITKSEVPEKSVILFLKLALIVYYLGIYVMSLELHGSETLGDLDKFFIMTTVNFICMPIINSVYSSRLFITRLN